MSWEELSSHIDFTRIISTAVLLTVILMARVLLLRQIASSGQISRGSRTLDP